MHWQTQFWGGGGRGSNRNAKSSWPSEVRFLIDSRNCSNKKSYQLPSMFQSASPVTVNNLLNLVTYPVQQAHHCQQLVYSTSRKSLNKRLASGHVLRLRPPTHWMQFALRSSACTCVCLRSSAFVCICLRLSMCVCVHLRASAYIRVRLLAFYRKV